MDNQLYIDYLTKLYNYRFFEENYDCYIKNHQNSKVIAIDLTKFKNINDTFGHEVGDSCLRLFGMILKNIFSGDEICARRSGDEFLILTNRSNEEIVELLDQVIDLVKEDYKLNLLPMPYKFNAGICPVEHGMITTLEKADATMYFAKKEDKIYRFFDRDFYHFVKMSELFLDDVSRSISDDKVSIFTKKLFYFNGNESLISDTISRDYKGRDILDKNKLSLLRSSSCLKRLDYCNLKKILEKGLINNSEKIIINIHGSTLLDKDDNFEKVIVALCGLGENDPSSFILCLDLDDIGLDWEIIIGKIVFLKQLGFEIALQNYTFHTDNPIINVWSNSEVDYVKVRREFWKNALENEKKSILLKVMIPVFEQTSTIPIFIGVNSKNEYEFLRSINRRDGMLIGNACSRQEKPLILKKTND